MCQQALSGKILINIYLPVFNMFNSKIFSACSEDAALESSALPFTALALEAPRATAQCLSNQVERAFPSSSLVATTSLFRGSHLTPSASQNSRHLWFPRTSVAAAELPGDAKTPPHRDWTACLYALFTSNTVDTHVVYASCDTKRRHDVTLYTCHTHRTTQARELIVQI